MITTRTAARAIAATVLLALAGAPAAHATHPGANGLVAFVSNRDGNLEIYTMRADGTGQVNLTNDSRADAEPAWAPDGSLIAFARGTTSKDVWVMSPTGSGQTNLTPGADTGTNGAAGSQPTWSPDGTRIAYTNGGDIWVMNADGSGKTNLTEDPTLPAAGSWPSWSPDGTTIAYIREANVWAMRSDGAAKHALTATTGAEKLPDWSPDGTRIAYEIGGQVWVMNADGTGPTALTGGAGQSGQAPSWAPDGTKIAFASNGFDAPNGYDIFLMDPDAGNRTRLPTAVPAADTDPAWQPTARSLPTVSIADRTVTEGNAGTVTARFTVTLSAASTSTVTVDYATAKGSAKPPADYATATGRLSFAPGETTKTLDVTVNGDTLYEATEKYTVTLVGSAGAVIADGQAAGKITNDDEPPAIRIADVSRTEGAAGQTSLFAFTVTLSAPSGLATKVDWSTADGTALAGSDYAAATGTLSIPAGQTSRTILVSVTGDAAAESAETFFVNLTRPVKGTLADAQALGTILNDD